MDAPATRPNPDIDPDETREWIEALAAAVEAHGKSRGEFLLERLEAEAQQRGLTQGLDRDWIETQLARMLSLSWRLPHSLFQGMQGVLYAVQSLSQGFSLTGFWSQRPVFKKRKSRPATVSDVRDLAYRAWCPPVRYHAGSSRPVRGICDMQRRCQEHLRTVRKDFR